MSQNGKVLRAIAFAQVRLVFSKGDIQHPVRKSFCPGNLAISRSRGIINANLCLLGVKFFSALLVLRIKGIFYV